MTTIPKIPNDILFNIFRENKINKQNEIWKKRHNLMIKHLEKYLEESGGEPIPELIYDGNIRYDVRFLEYDNAWNTSLHKCIDDIHGEDEVDYFADNCF